MKAIPLWIAVSITVVVALPFGLWLGSWNLPLWLAFWLGKEIHARWGKRGMWIYVGAWCIAGAIHTLSLNTVTSPRTTDPPVVVTVTVAPHP